MDDQLGITPRFTKKMSTDYFFTNSLELYFPKKFIKKPTYHLPTHPTHPTHHPRQALHSEWQHPGCSGWISSPPADAAEARLESPGRPAQTHS